MWVHFFNFKANFEEAQSFMRELVRHFVFTKRQWLRSLVSLNDKTEEQTQSELLKPGQIQIKLPVDFFVECAFMAILDSNGSLLKPQFSLHYI
jgi:hypothetical protein